MEKRVSRKVNSYTKERVIEIVRKVCGSYKTGEYTLESCCKNAGVPYRTYKDWWTRYERVNGTFSPMLQVFGRMHKSSTGT